MIPNQWYGILPSHDIKSGKLVSILRLNLHLVLFRNQSGELGCVEDQCSHRGAGLGGGKVKGDCLQCPFHGLEFLPNGDCRFIPASGKASTEDLSRFHVKSYIVKEAHGMVYLWFGDKKPTERDLLPFFEEYVYDTYAHSMISDHWNSHYSRCIENQLDVVHLPFVHYNTIGSGNKMIVNGPAVEYKNGLLRTSASNEKDKGQAPKKSDDCSISNNMFLGFRFPNVWLNHIAPKYMLIIYFAPVDDENTILYIHTYCGMTKIGLINYLITAISQPLAYIIERQDRRVVITQKPKPSSFHSNEKLLTGDRPIVLYRKLREEMKQAVNGEKQIVP